MKSPFRVLVFYVFALSPLFMGCSHFKSQPDFINCYQWVSRGDVSSLSDNWPYCKNSNNANATSLLMSASAHEDIEIMDFLFKKGVDLDEIDLQGDTALTYAAANNRHKSLVWLIEHGASPESFRQDKVTPLMVLFQRGQLDSLHYLISKPFKINEAMEDGWTPLFFAVRRENIEILQKLLDLGANPNLKSKTNETALDLAIEANWADGVNLLKRYKARIGKR